jgi:hypothetical protein
MTPDDLKKQKKEKNGKKLKDAGIAPSQSRRGLHVGATVPHLLRPFPG